MVRPSLTEKVLAYIQSESLFNSGDRVMVGVSGGADSLTLLFLLYELRHVLGINLFVAHYDHALRPRSDKDRIFVQSVAKKLGLPFITDVNRLPRPKTGSLEEFAREQRYAFFARAVKTSRASCVAVAHTMNDLAETVLMRVLRGSGLSGLRAMLPRRIINGMTVVRPLLQVTRSEVEGVVKDRRLKPIQDPTNRSDVFFRNRIRRKIIPFLEKESSKELITTLAGLASVVAVDHDFIETESSRYFSSLVRKGSGRLSVALLPYRRLHPSLRRSLLRMSLDELRGTLTMIEARHVLAIDRFALNGNGQGRVDLPAGLCAKIVQSRLVLMFRKAVAKA